MATMLTVGLCMSGWWWLKIKSHFHEQIAAFIFFPSPPSARQWTYVISRTTISPLDHENHGLALKPKSRRPRIVGPCPCSEPLSRSAVAPDRMTTRPITR